jgi:hypothetical protein
MTMKHHHHNQYPFSDALHQRLRRERLERRADAAYAFIKNFVIAALACWVMLALMAILDKGTV